MSSNNDHKAAMLRNLALMIKRFNVDDDSRTLCTEFDCGGIDCGDCILADPSSSVVKDLNEIADDLDGKNV